MAMRALPSAKNRVTNSLAGIQYAGEAGCTQECLDAVIRLIQCRAGISVARILTCSRDGGTGHCLLLTVYPGDLIAVKSGFTSGYGGEGPTGFSRALCLLHAHEAEIEEYIVDAQLMDRLDKSALTTKDLQTLEKARPRRPRHWSDYVDERDWDREHDGTLWHHWCEPVMPFAIVDCRIMDLAKTFWQDPDERLMTAYRRLEDIVRERTGIDDHGQGLFSTAFRGNSPILVWKGCNKGEQEGRASLFVGAYMAYRNPRAHRELEHDASDALGEFLILNQLFLLEKHAIEATI